MTPADAGVEVAWLDRRGVITAVNRAWDSFRQAELLTGYDGSVLTLVLSEAPSDAMFATVVAEAARLVDSENVGLLIPDRASLHLSGQVELDQGTLRRWAARDEPLQVAEPPEKMPEVLRKKAGPGVIVSFPGLLGQRASSPSSAVGGASPSAPARSRPWASSLVRSPRQWSWEAVGPTGRA